ncbi:hypothetical protein VULLAG_LOCUS22711 [Vulpes lagopus]
MALMTPESAVHTLLGTHFHGLVGPPSHLASFTAHSLQGVKAEKGPAPRSRRGVERGASSQEQTGCGACLGMGSQTSSSGISGQSLAVYSNGTLSVDVPGPRTCSPYPCQFCVNGDPFVFTRNTSQKNIVKATHTWYSRGSLTPPGTWVEMVHMREDGRG